ncbi:392_t:CDS:2, partial [Diversispora eburnea]
LGDRKVKYKCELSEFETDNSDTLDSYCSDILSDVITETEMASKNPIPLRYSIHNNPDGKIFTVWPYKEDKVYVIKFAIGSLLVNLGYQVLSLNFELYMNDPENKDLMKTSDEVSKYFNRTPDPNQIHILIKPGN